jgi:hypothetical protein
MSETVNLIRIYCSGGPDSPHERREIARMVRALRAGVASKSWAIASYGDERHRADDWDHDKFKLSCRCRVNVPVVMDETKASRGREQFLKELDDKAEAGESELSLYALAAIVSTTSG